MAESLSNQVIDNSQAKSHNLKSRLFSFIHAHCSETNINMNAEL